MAEANWYCNKGGKRLGPFNFAQLKQMADAGMILPNDRVFGGGDPSNQLQEAASVPNLFSTHAPIRMAAADPKIATPAPRSSPPAAPRSEAIAGDSRIAEANWYCNKCGHRMGPYTLAQLKQMVVAKMVTPGDLVIREGETEWVEASTRVELFAVSLASKPIPSPTPSTPTSPPPPLSPPPSTPASPLVVCEKCHAKISDITEHCPQCGHPQVPLEAKKWGQSLVPCPQCKTVNRVRTYLEFLSKEVCRGCGRPNTEMYPEQHFECQVDEVFRTYLRCKNSLYWGIVGVAVVCFAFITRFIAVQFSPELNLAGLIGGGVLGYVCSFPLFSMIYYRLFVRGRGLPPPNESRTISSGDWERAAQREDNERQRRDTVQPAASPPKLSWWHEMCGIVGGWVVVVLIGYAVLRNSGNLDEHSQSHKPPPLLTPRQATPVVAEFTARREERSFSHDLLYTYTGTEKLEDVDFTLTVRFDKGTKQEIKQFYATWSPGETKKVNLSASNGIVQKHELRGKARRGTIEVLVEQTFSKKAAGEK